MKETNNEKLIDWNEYPCGANGQIYSHAKKRMLKGYVNKDGYKRVILKCVDGKQRLFNWHRVIYTYFCGTIPEGMQINHINEDKTDNRLCNLELVTPKENNNWGTRTERAAAKQRGIPKPHMIEYNKKTKSKAVVGVDKEGNIVLEFESTREIERQMGFKHGNVSACCRNCYGKLGNYYKGYYWYFKEDYLKIIKGVA